MGHNYEWPIFQLKHHKNTRNMIKFEDIMFLYYQGDLQTKIYHVKLFYSS